ncbi:uncharacterized protein LOC129760195 [Uranotaenia lowii]|uniref:uncharacterized protein LOC129760195 n=1 Tax=Uranotaenia lowii TaxID=190385 RepID=UPI0024799417|nr:uncharacterized protein LOC129760195 [Uranotaenia lowii]
MFKLSGTFSACQHIYLDQHDGTIRELKGFKFKTYFVSISHFPVAAPKYQILEPREGYVPVYIRYGNQPLSEINPALAAAFHEPVSRVNRARLARQLQGDDLVNNTSSNSTSISASDEHRVKQLVAAELAKQTRP